VTQTRKQPAARLTLALAACCCAAGSGWGQTAAQTPPQPSASPAPAPPRPTASRSIVFLDPAHGGADTGAHLDDNHLEKDLTLAFAVRLKALLSTGGFSVISTRDADPATPITTDQRAEIANHSHAIACLIIHATASGSGVHIFTSALTPSDSLDEPHGAVPWNRAQELSIPQSLRLANQLGSALLQAKLPVILSQASIRPLDNLTCPAVAVEIAPLTIADSDPTPVTNAAYEQKVAQALVAALTAWRTHNPAGAGR
jgi:N-acetylmuramoyl-L-alanine amidase